MPETNNTTPSAGAVPDSPTGQGKGLAELGYSREGYLDRGYLDTLLVPIGKITATGNAGGQTGGEGDTSIQQKLLEYASNRENIRNTRLDGYVTEYLVSEDSNSKTVDLYKDLYDAYKLSNPNSDVTQAGFIRQITNMDSKLNPKSAAKALDGKIGMWSDDPTNFLTDMKGSKLDWGDSSADAWATSADIGEVMGWDSGAYDRSYNLTGLEGFASRSRTLKTREEEARQAELKRLQEERDRLLAAQQTRQARTGNDGPSGANPHGGGGGWGDTTDADRNFG